MHNDYEHNDVEASCNAGQFTETTRSRPYTKMSGVEGNTRG